MAKLFIFLSNKLEITLVSNVINGLIKSLNSFKKLVIYVLESGVF
jgi:hypothetical protein